MRLQLLLLAFALLARTHICVGSVLDTSSFARSEVSSRASRLRGVMGKRASLTHISNDPHFSRNLEQLADEYEDYAQAEEVHSSEFDRFLNVKKQTKRQHDYEYDPLENEEEDEDASLRIDLPPTSIELDQADYDIAEEDVSEAELDAYTEEENDQELLGTDYTPEVDAEDLAAVEEEEEDSDDYQDYQQSDTVTGTSDSRQHQGAQNGGSTTAAAGGDADVHIDLAHSFITTDPEEANTASIASLVQEAENVLAQAGKQARKDKLRGQPPGLVHTRQNTEQQQKEGVAVPSQYKQLPAFERTPLPPKQSIVQWQSKYGAAEPQEMGSATFLLPDAPQRGYVAACVVARDAHVDIVEWVHYHLKLGIWPIYVFDHGSIPPMSGVLSSYVQSKTVVYHYFTTFQHATEKPQLYAYDRCLKEYGAKHTWIAFLDVDEFLVFKKGPPVQSLPSLLQLYEPYSALAVHWILFGSSGYTIRPSKGVLRSYYKCLPLEHDQHLFIKTIANTKCTLGTSHSPHVFIHNCSTPVVRTDVSPVTGPKASNVMHDTLALHHYAIKSEEEFLVKMARGSGMKRQRGWEYFWFVDKWSTDFNFDVMSVWDDDAAFQPLLGPQALAMQLEAYENEEHEQFWNKGANTMTN